VFVQALDSVRVEFVVEERTLAADQVRVEVVRLNAVDDRRHFSQATAAEF
jgi:hypothetical protein